MKRRALLYAFIAAAVGVGCSLVVSYDGYGDGVRGDDGGAAETGGGTDATTGDGDTANDGGGTDSGSDGSDAAIDAGPDGSTTKKYALVLLGGERFDDAGVSNSVANVDIAMINADGTLGPWSAATPMPSTEDAVGAASWGSSIFIMDDFGARSAVVLPDAGLSSWGTIANVNRNSPQLVAVDGRLYVAGGTAPGGAEAPEVFYATITGPQTIGAWTATTPLSVVDGGPRNDTTMLAAGKVLYLVGGDHASVDIASILSAPIDNTGAVGQWVENTPLPTVGDKTRTILARGHLTVVGASFEIAGDRDVYTSLIGDGGVLGPWQSGTQHPDVIEPTVAMHNDFVYLISGEPGTARDTDSPAVYYAPIQSNGFPGTWQTTTNVVVPRHNGKAVVVEVP